MGISGYGTEVSVIFKDNQLSLFSPKIARNLNAILIQKKSVRLLNFEKKDSPKMKSLNL